MPIDVRCGCGKRFRVGDEAAGRKGRCPACKAVLTIPHLGDASGTYDLDAAPASPPPLPAFADAARAARAAAPAGNGVAWKPRDEGEDVVEDEGGELPAIVDRPRMPPEPWYYGAVALLGGVVAALGIAMFALVVGLVIHGGLQGYGRGEAGRTWAYAAASAVLASGVLMVVGLVVGAPILLAVDAARNLRVLRYRP